MKEFIKIFLILSLCSSFTGCSYRSYYEKAEMYYQNMSYSKAAVYFEKVVDKTEYPLAKSRIADCYRQMNNKEKQEFWLRQMVESNQDDFSDQLSFAQILMVNGKYDEAKYWLKKYSYKKFTLFHRFGKFILY